MTENITLMISAQTQQQQQQQQPQLGGAQKPRPLGRVRVQGQRAAGPAGQRKSEDFSVQGEAFSTATPEKQAAVSSSSLPPIGQQSPQLLQQRQSSVQSASSGSPPSDAGRLVRLQQREQELLKKLQDAAAREKLFKEQVERLEKMLADAQQLLEAERLSRKDTEAELAQSSDSGDRYRRLYEEECREHASTRELVEQMREQFRSESARLQARVGELKAQLAEQGERHEGQLAQLRKEHEKALADRDKRIDNLKRQVAGALGTNSHERQSQIDQLNRELQKLADEIETLRKRPPGPAGGTCQQCTKKDAAIRDQGEQIRQLRVICQRFRGQLGEQEQLLVAMLDSRTNGVSATPQVKR